MGESPQTSLTMIVPQIDFILRNNFFKGPFSTKTIERK